MSYEISASWYLLSGAAAFLGLAYYLRPRVAVRSYVGHHKDLQVLEIAFIFSICPAFSAPARDAPGSRSVEFVIYTTLKTGRG
jgi:hypothetical protein